MSSRGTRLLSESQLGVLGRAECGAPSPVSAVPLLRQPGPRCVGPLASASPGASPRGSVLPADRDSFLGDGPFGNSPHHPSRWELARQSCGGRYVAPGGQKWVGIPECLLPNIPGKPRVALVPLREVQIPGR